MEVPRVPDRYDTFLEMVISDISDTSISTEVRENPEYIRECLQAIDISRILTLKHPTSESKVDSINSIDAVLGGHINRRVLDMVRAILLSRSEMMNGSGYPFGLCKKDIPLEARLYAIIRSYEALCHQEKNAERVRNRLSEWNQGGYFDAHIFSVFMKFLESGVYVQNREEHSDLGARVTTYRERYYQNYLDSYSDLEDLIRQIEDIYEQFRHASHDMSLRSRLSIRNHELQSALSEKAQFSKIIYVTGHGQTHSDTIEGQPGSDDEGLTSLGIESSERKRNMFDGIAMTIYSSPFQRALETATIIYGDRMRSNGVPLGIVVVDALRNPKKYLSNDRGLDAITKLIVDQPLGILDFIRRSMFSPQDSQSLLVAHGTTNGYVMGILANLGSKDRILIEIVPIKDDSIEACLMRGGRHVKWDIFFPFADWRGALEEVEILCENIFGERFFSGIAGRINLIFLHRKFLDYMDRKMEESPELIEQFLKQLDSGHRTKHFRSMLRKSDIADKKLL